MEHTHHTCDRCGKKINGNLKALSFMRFVVKKPMNIRVTTPNGYVAREFIDEFSNELNLEIHGCNEYKYFELCGNCRKDFERFMRNE